MITVSSAIQTELASGTSAVEWYVDLVTKGGGSYRLQTSSNCPDHVSYTNAELLVSPVSFKRKLGTEFDKYNIEIAMAASGAVETVVDSLLGEIVDGTLDQAVIDVYMYCASTSVLIDTCRVEKVRQDETTLRLSCTNQIEAFKGKFPRTVHAPQVWARVEDTLDNPVNVWDQSSTTLGTAQGRWRKGAKVNPGIRTGFNMQWANNNRGNSDDLYVYPWAYGQKLVVEIPRDHYGPFICTEGVSGGYWSIAKKDGSVLSNDPTTIKPFQSVTYSIEDDRWLEKNSFVTDTNYWPVYSAISGDVMTMEREQERFVTFDGRKHYAYDASGNKVTTGDGFSSDHGGYTNPIWACVDWLMNGLGLLHSQVNWASAKDTADRLLADGYDLRFVINERKKVSDILDKMALNGGFVWSWSGGQIHFDRREPSKTVASGYTLDNTDFQGWLHAFGADVLDDTFNYSDQSRDDQPNKFNVKYLVQGKDTGDRYYHFIQDHTFEIVDKNNTKDESKDIELDWLYDPDSFESATGESLPMLEAIKNIRMMREQKRFSFETSNLNAFLLQGADPVTLEYDLNSLAIGSPSLAECEVESVSFSGGNSVSVTLKPRFDTWWEPDPYLFLDGSINWSTVGAAEANVPSYRFIAISGDVSSGVLIQNFEADDTLNGGLDDRALAPGNVLWAEDYTTTHRDWDTVSSSTGTTRYWKPLGIIASTEASELFGVPGIYVEFEETIWNSGLVAQYHRIQCQPTATFYADAKTERGGSKDQFFNMVMNLNFTNVWNYAAGAVDMAASSDGGAAYTDLNNNPVWALGPSNQSSTFEISGFSKTSYLSNAFPGCCSFKILTKNGIQGTEDIYVFSESLGVSKEGGDDAKISFLAYPFCDFTEIGMILQTDWDEQENPNVTFKIEFDTGATFSAGEGIVYGYTGVDPATYAPQPPFKEQFFSKIISGSVTVPATPTVFYDLTDYTLAALKIGTQITLRLTTYDSSGSVIDTDDITLTRRNRQFENYFGTINKATGHKGAGMLMATTNWGLFADTWTKNSSGVNDYSNWSGGIYVYPKDPSGTRIDPTAWTRYGVDPQTGIAVDTGPSFAVETSGETKLAYFNNAGANSGSSGTYYESGALFYTFPDSASRHTYKGEFLIGLGKAFSGLCAWNATTSLQSSPTNTSATGLDGSGSGYEYRGAALRILRNGTYYTSNSWKPLVHAFHLAVDGLLVGGGALHQNSVSDTMDPESSPGVVLYTANGNTHIPTYDSSNFLAGWTDTGSGTRWHSYAYVQTNGSTAEGLIIPSAANGIAYAGGHRVLKIQTKLGSDSSVRPYYAHLSESENYVYIPGASSGDGYLHYNNADLEYNWGGSIWKTLLTTDLYNYDPTNSSKYYLFEQGAKDTVIFPNRTLILPAASANFQCCLYDDGTNIYLAAVHDGTWKKVQLT